MPEKKCPSCQGKGEVLCQGCSGTGVQGGERITDDSIRAWSSCASCKGRGTIKCRDCNGTGKL